MSWEPKTAYHLAEDTISKEDISSHVDWLIGTEEERTGPTEYKTPWLTMGPRTKEFETEFAKQVGAEHAVFVNSGSSANLLAWYLPIMLSEKEITENPRVVVPAVAWSTSVSEVFQFGLKPVFCEAEAETWGMDPVVLRRICEKQAPSIVLLVHMLGVPCDMKAIAELKEEFEFILIEDACGAFGSEPIGTVGELTTYSTFYGHQLSTVEGGVVATNADEGDRLLRMLRANGWAADLEPEFRAALAKAAKVDPFREKFTFYYPGFNVRPTDMAAQLGLSQLKRAAATTAARRANHATYFACFRESEHFDVQTAAADNSAIASIGFGVLAKSKTHRRRVGEALAAKGIETRPVGGGNMARQPFVLDRLGEARVDRPIADRIHDCGFQLPNHPGLTPEDIGYIAETVLAVKP